jgi:hypothetical protein
LFLKAEGEEKELAQIKEAVSYISSQCQSEQLLDIVCMGITPGNEPEQAADMVKKRADLGATWWLELIAPFRFGKGLEDEWPVEALRERILQGPPQIRRTS